VRIRFTHGFFLTSLAVVFTIGLTFASIELPSLLSSLLYRTIPHPAGDSHADDLSVFRTELYIQHYHIRLIGYISLALVIMLIAAGFITKRSGLASAGAFVFLLPIFAQFAGVMFFLAGLGILNLIWLPILDTSFKFLSLGDIAYVPYRILSYLSSLFSFDIHTPLVYALTGLGLLIFFLGTVAWLYARFQKRNIADFWIYRLSRHPQYLGWIIWSYGLLIYLMRIHYPKRSWGIPSSLPWLLSSMVIVGVAMLEELKMQSVSGQEYETYRRRVSFMLPMPRFVSKIASFPMRLIIRKEYPERKREVAATIALYTAMLIALSVIFGSFTSLSEVKMLVSSEYREKETEELVRVFKETKDRRARYHAAESLSKIGEPAVDLIMELLKDENAAIREYSAQILGEIKPKKAVRPLIELLRDNDQNVCCKAAWALGEIKSQEAIQPLIDSLQSDDGVIRYNMAAALGKLGSEQAVDALIFGLRDEQWYVRIANANALGEIKSGKAVEPLIEALKDENEKVRRASALALLRTGSEKSAEALTEALRDEDWEVRFYAAEALKAIRK